mmetsp:Transcript_116807/g.325487  ORF Transcript_116807/g.325487 Transcript_116807/m.325487 type:complete len:202 (-) Transcript_116807:164-769(-)
MHIGEGICSVLWLLVIVVVQPFERVTGLPPSRALGVIEAEVLQPLRPLLQEFPRRPCLQEVNPGLPQQARPRAVAFVHEDVHASADLAEDPAAAVPLRDRGHAAEPVPQDKEPLLALGGTPDDDRTHLLHGILVVPGKLLPRTDEAYAPGLEGLLVAEVIGAEEASKVRHQCGHVREDHEEDEATKETDKLPVAMADALPH